MDIRIQSQGPVLSDRLRGVIKEAVREWVETVESGRPTHIEVAPVNLKGELLVVARAMNGSDFLEQNTVEVEAVTHRLWPGKVFCHPDELAPLEQSGLEGLVALLKEAARMANEPGILVSPMTATRIQAMADELEDGLTDAPEGSSWKPTKPRVPRPAGWGGR